MKKNRKKIILFLLSAVMMTGCTSPSARTDDSKSSDQKKTEEQIDKTTSRDASSTESKTASNTESKNASDRESNSKTESIGSDENEPSDMETPIVTPDVREQPASADSIRLAVPQFVQETNYYCAVACLQMVLAYHGINVSQSTLAAGLNTSPVSGTEYADLAREASKYIFGKAPENDTEPGYRALLWTRNAGTDQMKEQFFARANADLRSGDPVFVSINPHLAYGESVETVHELVLYGADFDEQGNATHYYCIDPYGKYQDSAFGGKKVFTADELWNAMNNNPEPGYVW